MLFRYRRGLTSAELAGMRERIECFQHCMCTHPRLFAVSLDQIQLLHRCALADNRCEVRCEVGQDAENTLLQDALGIPEPADEACVLVEYNQCYNMLAAVLGRLRLDVGQRLSMMRSISPGNNSECFNYHSNMTVDNAAFVRSAPSGSKHPREVWHM